MPRGRPTAYTAALADEICRRLSEGETLAEICRSEHIPPRPTVLDWVRENRDGFSNRYAHARELLLEHWADDLIEIGDNGRNDWMERNGEPAFNFEHVQRSRLRSDNRKWLLSRLNPSKYGDRVTTEHTGPGGGPVQQEITLSPAEAYRRLKDGA